TLALVSTVGALAAQISAVPAWALARRRSRQVRPPPVTFENDWLPPPDPPPGGMKASRSSPEALVGKGGEGVDPEELVWWVCAGLSTGTAAEAVPVPSARTTTKQRKVRTVLTYIVLCLGRTEPLVNDRGPNGYEFGTGEFPRKRQLSP